MPNLAARMQALNATDAEVGALIGRSPEQVAQWREGDTEIDAEARILLRPFLADDDGHAASLALERIRNTYTRSLEGEAVGAANTQWPGDDRRTGGRPE